MTDLNEWKKEVQKKRDVLKIEEYELEKEIIKRDHEDKIKRLDDAIARLKGE